MPESSLPDIRGIETEERWRAIAGWPGYEVSWWGRVRSFWGLGGGRRAEPKIIGGYVGKSGHRMAVLYRNGSREKRTAGIHVLVLEAFVGPCPDGMEGCHFPDRDPANNRLDNLRWDTRGENQRDAVRHGTHRHAKLTEWDIPDIWARLVAGDTNVAIARDHGVSDGTIATIRRGKRWDHITRMLPGWPLYDRALDSQPPVFVPDEYAKSPVEIWKVIPDWPAYRVSNSGLASTCWQRDRRGRWATSDEWTPRLLHPNRDGHLYFNAHDGSGRKAALYVHRNVLLLFAGPCPPGMLGCHIDDDKGNNHVGNLKWDTHGGNARDRERHRRVRVMT